MKVLPESFLLIQLSICCVLLCGCNDDEDDKVIGGGQCRLESMQFDVNGMKIYSKKTNAEGGAGKGCNSKGACVVANGDTMISSSPPLYPVGSNAVLHSLTGQLHSYNGQEVLVVRYDIDQDKSRVEVKVMKTNEILFVNTNYLRPVLHINQKVRVTSFAQQQSVSSASSFLEFGSALVQNNGDDDILSGQDVKVDTVDVAAVENVVFASRQLTTALENLLPSRIPLNLYPDTAEVFNSYDDDDHGDGIRRNRLYPAELAAAEAVRLRLAQQPQVGQPYMHLPMQTTQQPGIHQPGDANGAQPNPEHSQGVPPDPVTIIQGAVRGAQVRQNVADRHQQADQDNTQQAGQIIDAINSINIPQLDEAVQHASPTAIQTGLAYLIDTQDVPDDQRLEMLSRLLANLHSLLDGDRPWGCPIARTFSSTAILSDDVKADMMDLLIEKGPLIDEYDIGDIDQDFEQDENCAFLNSLTEARWENEYQELPSIQHLAAAFPMSEAVRVRIIERIHSALFPGVRGDQNDNGSSFTQTHGAVPYNKGGETALMLILRGDLVGVDEPIFTKQSYRHEAIDSFLSRMTTAQVSMTIGEGEGLNALLYFLKSEDLQRWHPTSNFQMLRALLAKSTKESLLAKNAEGQSAVWYIVFDNAFQEYRSRAVAAMMSRLDQEGIRALGDDGIQIFSHLHRNIMSCLEKFTSFASKWRQEAQERAKYALVWPHTRREFEEFNQDRSNALDNLEKLVKFSSEMQLDAVELNENIKEFDELRGRIGSFDPAAAESLDETRKLLQVALKLQSGGRKKYQGGSEFQDAIYEYSFPESIYSDQDEFDIARRPMNAKDHYRLKKIITSHAMTDTDRVVALHAALLDMRNVYLDFRVGPGATGYLEELPALHLAIVTPVIASDRARLVIVHMLLSTGPCPDNPEHRIKKHPPDSVDFEHYVHGDCWRFGSAELMVPTALMLTLDSRVIQSPKTRIRIIEILIEHLPLDLGVQSRLEVVDGSLFEMDSWDPASRAIAPPILCSSYLLSTFAPEPCYGNFKDFPHLSALHVALVTESIDRDDTRLEILNLLLSHLSRIFGSVDHPYGTEAEVTEGPFLSFGMTALQMVALPIGRHRPKWNASERDVENVPTSLCLIDPYASYVRQSRFYVRIESEAVQIKIVEALLRHMTPACVSKVYPMCEDLYDDVDVKDDGGLPRKEGALVWNYLKRFDPDSNILQSSVDTHDRIVQAIIQKAFPEQIEPCHAIQTQHMEMALYTLILEKRTNLMNFMSSCRHPTKFRRFNLPDEIWAKYIIPLLVPKFIAFIRKANPELDRVNLFDLGSVASIFYGGDQLRSSRTESEEQDFWDRYQRMFINLKLRGSPRLHVPEEYDNYMKSCESIYFAAPFCSDSPRVVEFRKFISVFYFRTRPIIAHVNGKLKCYWYAHYFLRDLFQRLGEPDLPEVERMVDVMNETLLPFEADVYSLWHRSVHILCDSLSNPDFALETPSREFLFEKSQQSVEKLKTRLSDACREINEEWPAADRWRRFWSRWIIFFDKEPNGKQKTYADMDIPKGHRVRAPGKVFNYFESDEESSSSSEDTSSSSNEISPADDSNVESCQPNARPCSFCASIDKSMPFIEFNTKPSFCESHCLRCGDLFTDEDPRNFGVQHSNADQQDDLSGSSTTGSSDAEAPSTAFMETSTSLQASLAGIDPSIRMQSMIAQARARHEINDVNEKGVHRHYKVDVEALQHAVQQAKRRVVSSMSIANRAFTAPFKNTNITSIKSDFDTLLARVITELAMVWRSATASETKASRAISDLSNAINDWFSGIISTGTTSQEVQIASITQQIAQSRKILLETTNRLADLPPLSNSFKSVQPFKYEYNPWRLGRVIRAETSGDGHYSWVYVEELETGNVIFVNVIAPVNENDRENVFFENEQELRYEFSSQKPSQDSSFVQTLRDRRAEAATARAFKQGFEPGFASALLQYGQQQYGVCRCNPGVGGLNCATYLNNEDDPHHGKLKTGYIILIVGSSVVVLIILIIAFLCINSRRKTKKVRQAEREEIIANNKPRTYVHTYDRTESGHDVLDPALCTLVPIAPAEEEVEVEDVEEVPLHIPGNIRRDQIITDAQVVEEYGIYEGYNSKLEKLVDTMPTTTPPLATIPVQPAAQRATASHMPANQVTPPLAANPAPVHPAVQRATASNMQAPVPPIQQLIIPSNPTPPQPVPTPATTSSYPSSTSNTKPVSREPSIP